jgi:hypothetical protein
VVASHYYPHSDKVYLVFIFLVDYVNGEPIDSDGGKLEWIDVDKVTKLDKLYPDLKINLPTVLKDSPEIAYTSLTFNEQSELM